MLRLAADENFNHKIVRGVRLRKADIDLIIVRDVLPSADDPRILEWAARENRVILTHDANTMTKYAYERVRSNLPMPGLFVVPLDAPIGQIIDDLVMIGAYATSEDYSGRVEYFPM